MNQPTICRDCHSVAIPRLIKKGSTAAESIFALTALFIFFFTFSVIITIAALTISICYSSWRRSSVAYVCPTCGGKAIPLETPLAQELLARARKVTA